MSRPGQNRVEIRIRYGVTDLVQRTDPRYTVSPEAEEILNDLVDEFIGSVTRHACRLAASRVDGQRGDATEIKVDKTDFLYALQHDWGIVLNPRPSGIAGGVRSRSSHREALQAVENVQQASYN